MIPESLDVLVHLLAGLATFAGGFLLGRWSRSRRLFRDRGD